MTYDPENIFAKIIRGEAVAHKVYEDEHTLAFMDLMPQAQGHTLVIPKSPAVDLLDIEPDALSKTIQTTQHIAQAVKQAFDADGIMIAQLSGRAAGQSVFHLHFHILPRHGGIDFRLHAQKVAPAQQLEANAEKIRKVLSRGQGKVPD